MDFPDYMDFPELFIDYLTLIMSWWRHCY